MDSLSAGKNRVKPQRIWIRACAQDAICMEIAGLTGKIVFSIQLHEIARTDIDGVGRICYISIHILGKWAFLPAFLTKKELYILYG